MGSGYKCNICLNQNVQNLRIIKIYHLIFIWHPDVLSDRRIAGPSVVEGV